MPTYATVGDVFSRVRGLLGDSVTAFSSSTEPSETDVENWMDEAVGAIHSCLRSVNVTPLPMTDAFAIAKLGEMEIRYAEGRVRRLVAGYGGDQGNRDGQDLIDKFFEDCEKLKAQRQLTQEGLDPSQTVQTASNYVTNPQGPDTLTEADWKPRFTRKQKY